MAGPCLKCSPTKSLSSRAAVPEQSPRKKVKVTAYQVQLEAPRTMRSSKGGLPTAALTQMPLKPTENGRTMHKAEQPAVDFDAKWSREAIERKMPGLRQLATEFYGLPDMVPMHGGLPPASAFPIESMSLRLKDGTVVDIEDPALMRDAQQYNMHMKGHPVLHAWLMRHMQELHAPPGGHEIIVTNGSNPTLEILIHLFMEKGDPILCEEFTYPHVPESLLIPVGYKSVGLPLDAQGICPDGLRRTLETLQKQGHRIPRLLYLIPTGQNPTGATMGEARKREVYEICRQWDILILEDDPYYYLQFPQPGEEPLGLKNLGHSFLSMDVDGRVMRLDSFSKVMAPGMRLGWLTAHPAILNKTIFHLHGVALGPASLSQVVVGEMLRSWGDAGFEAHLKNVQAQYARRVGLIQAAAERHLSGLAEWERPRAGMFLWVRLLAGVLDSSSVMQACKDARVIVVPGRWSNHSGPEAECAPCPYVRISFVACAEHELEVGIQRLGQVLREFAVRGDKPTMAMAIDDPPASNVAPEIDLLKC